MASTNPEANTDTAGSAVLSLTWWFTQTYRYPTVPLDAVAAAGRAVDELAADPASLLGVVGDRLAELLTGYQASDRVVGMPEVEIAAADYDASPTLAGLVDAGRAALRAESDSGQSSAAGRALAALLAGLRREGITDR